MKAMSNKQAIINLIQQLPDDVTVEGILAALRKHYAPGAPLAEGSDWSAEELTEDEWRQLVAYGLRDELNDPREDIYSESDGEPLHDHEG
jgi:hypothetical protein